MKKNKMIVLALASMLLASCGGRDPMSSSSIPGSEPPAPESSEAVVTSSRESEEPIASSEEPIVSSEEPVVSSEEPVTSSEEPVISSEEPQSEESSLASSSLPEGVYELAKPTMPEVPAYCGKSSTGVFYEIFVYSFADSNGDGIGDLNGIRGKLDYLANLGVEGIWLTPIHPSSTYHKYNVDDYYEIDSSFGDLNDFESLVYEAHQKGIHVMMDMVFNHSSTRHPWFTKALEDFADEYDGEDSYKDLYSMAFDYKDFTGVTTKAVNVHGRTVYYECNFDQDMPEFNLNSDITKRMHKDVMSYWIDKGVDGFRFDGVAYYYKGNNSKCFDYCGYLAEAARELKPNVDLIGEFMNGTASIVNQMANSKMTCFNFPTDTSTTSSPIVAQNGHSGIRFTKYAASAMTNFLKNSDGVCLPAFFLSNHDQNRWANDRMTLEKMKNAAAMYLLTPGTPFLYYGEEIELRGVRQNAQTDANRRLPMQWLSDASQDYARPVACPENDYKGTQTSLGALEAIQDPDSLVSFYKKTIAFRKDHPEIQKGLFLTATASGDPFVAFEIHYQGKTSYVIHCVETEPIQIYVGENLTMDASLCFGKDAPTYQNGIVTMSPYDTVYLETIA